MSAFHRTPGEAARLTRLHDLHILDTAREPLFDGFVRMAAEVCGSSIAVITLIDAERQWFKADFGLGGLSETPREYAFCKHTIECDELMEVPDARDDPRFANNPFVNHEPGVRFYAGAPLILFDGTRVGALCVLDTHVRRLDDSQRRTLTSLAGLVTQALVMRRDLIERTRLVHHEAEQALAAKSAELDDLYTNAPCGYYSLDAEGCFVRINDAALRWFGFPRDELARRPSITEFMDANGRQFFNARFPRLKHDGRVVDIEYDLVCRNGQRRHVIGSASAVVGRDGEFLMTRTVVHDITELHRAREHLRRLGIEQRAIIDTDLVGIIKIKDRTIAWANKGIEKLLGWPLDEITGRSTRMFYRDDAAYVEAGIAAKALLTAGGGVHRAQVPIDRKDGSEVVVDISVMQMPGQPGEVLCVLQDITELKRAEEIRIRANALEAENRQLVEAARMKGVFLANMSHEFYTPLNAIIGYAHLLGTGAFPADSPRFARYLADIGASGQQLLAQVQSVLAYTDAESGRIRLQPQRVALRAVLESVVDIARPAARARDVDVVLSVEPDALELMIDPMRLSQAMSHALSNAIRFSHAGGAVAVRARAVGTREVVVDVEDHGVGIAPADLPRLFTPFQQLSQGLARTHEGAGLGLALTRRVMEAMGGSIGVASTPGVGSVFTFTLPRVMPEAGTSEAATDA